jgi:hypothetical protein
LSLARTTCHPNCNDGNADDDDDDDDDDDAKDDAMAIVELLMSNSARRFEDLMSNSSTFLHAWHRATFGGLIRVHRAHCHSANGKALAD